MPVARLPPARRPDFAIRIGTSGWHYKHWLGTFYPEKLSPAKMLAFYIREFDTVEINNSFYGLPAETTVAAWYASTPPDFCFALKGSRFLTHMKKLKDPEAGLEKFFGRADLLKDKLGPVLFQLPPNWPLDMERLDRFLNALPPDHSYSFEFREPSWHVPEVYSALRRRNAAFCIFDLAGFEAPREITADFAYIRLHGPGGRYQGSYEDAALENWARWISRHRELRGVYVYFDNDMAGYAPRNAARLREMAS